MLIRLVFALKNHSLEKKLAATFADADAQIVTCGRTRNPWQRLAQSCGDVIVISESLVPRPVDSGLQMLNGLPETPTTIILDDSDSPEKHARLLASGADVVLYSGLELKDVADAINTTLESRLQLLQLDRLEHLKRVRPKLSDFISASDRMRIFIEDVRQVVPSNSTLLLLGETGVGKEHLAKAIHAESPRSSGPFVALNTAALPDQLLESELFGHTRGAYTGATRSRRGSFELAHGGTIFLDEIGEMPLHLQAKLLRVLQEYEVKPLGAEKPIYVDVRVIAATNRDLEQEVAAGGFRKDLYYRLGVMSLYIPPLRERREDVPSLARRFLSYYRYKINREINTIGDAAMEALCNYDWPGNVRELMNVIERSMLICRGDEITRLDLPSSLAGGIQSGGGAGPGTLIDPSSWGELTLPEVQAMVGEQVERAYIEMALAKTGGKVGEAARLAGIHPRGLYNKMQRHGLRKETFKGKKG